MTDMIQKHGISGNGLKLTAIITMIIDHAGYMFFPGQMIFRYMGSIAFPIYCFLLVEGFFHTRSIGKYMARLGLFALLSEIPFDLALYKSFYDPMHSNVLFTLLLGLAAICGAEFAYRKTGDRTFGLLLCLAAMTAAYTLHTDYDYKGIVIIYIFYLSWEGRNYGTERGRITTAVLAFFMEALVFLSFQGNRETYAIISLMFLFFYSGMRNGDLWRKVVPEKADTVFKYLFYLVYPIHLLIFYFIYVIIN